MFYDELKSLKAFNLSFSQTQQRHLNPFVLDDLEVCPFTVSLVVVMSTVGRAKQVPPSYVQQYQCRLFYYCNYYYYYHLLIILLMYFLSKQSIFSTNVHRCLYCLILDDVQEIKSKKKNRKFSLCVLYFALREIIYLQLY